VNGEFCVSCYNRTREVARGRNGKGNRPIVVEGRLHAVSLALSTGETCSTAVETFPTVTSVVEAMILAAKAATGPVIFSLPAPGAAAGAALQ
jgi:hypothetical protein